MKEHLVSVVMPAYNAENFIKEAIESILFQTFTDFEFIIINDASTDSTESIIKSFSDPRIRLIENEKNLGLAKSLNIGFELAKGKYIARMDADDISLPKRFQKQFDFMEKNLNIDILSTWASRSDGVILIPPVSHNYISINFAFGSPIVHAATFFRKEKYLKKEMHYKTEFNSAEDYELWVNAFFSSFVFANIPEYLYYINVSGDRISKRNTKIQLKLGAKVRRLFFEGNRIKYSRLQEIIHESLVYRKYELTPCYVEEVSNWLSELYISLRKVDSLDSVSVRKTLCLHWLSFCWYVLKNKPIMLSITLKQDIAKLCNLNDYLRSFILKVGGRYVGEEISKNS